MDFTSILKSVAPWIGTALGGPLGGLAVGAACDALGVSEKTSDNLKNALAGVTPEQALALQTADQSFKLQMQTLGFKQVTDIEALEDADRKDARALAVSTKSEVPRNLTYLLTAGMTALMTALVFKGLPESQALTLLLGTYTTAWLASVTYWFGSTHGSSVKTDMLSQSTPT